MSKREGPAREEEEETTSTVVSSAAHGLGGPAVFAIPSGSLPETHSSERRLSRALPASRLVTQLPRPLDRKVPPSSRARDMWIRSRQSDNAQCAINDGESRQRIRQRARTREITKGEAGSRGGASKEEARQGY